MKTTIVTALLVGGILPSLQAQTTTVSQISGIVQDATGASVAGSQVTVTNTDTSASRTAVSGPDGAYAITNLVVGPYRLQVTKEGFATYNQSGIVLQVNTNPEINVVLKVGAVTEQVEVQANAGMVETQNTSVGQVIDQQRVVDLPLNGRNPAQLISLSGAAVVNTVG